MVHKMLILIKNSGRKLKNEKGQVLPLVLILLVLGATLLAGSLTYAATTVNTSGISVTNMEQFYAADAGAKDAIWRFKHDYWTMTGNVGAGTYTYNPSPVNGQELEVTSTFYSKGIYKIVCEAYSKGRSTTVEYFITGVSVFFTNPAVAAGSVDDLPSGELVPNKKIENYEYFPTTASLRTFYQSPPHPALTHVAGGAVDTTGDISRGDLYYEGDLSVAGTGTLTLTGNLFVDGNIDFTNSTWTVNLNGHTIYCTGEITQAKKKGYFDGPGCIIAEGNIGLWPQSTAGYEDEYIFIMSVLGSVDIQPNGSFYGSVAGGGGGVSITLQPGAKVSLTSLPLGGLDYPDDPNTYEWSVSNWKYQHQLELFIITAIYAPGEVGIPYSETTIAKNGSKPYTWAVTSGALPDGLSLDGSTGKISGTPSTATGSPSPIFIITVTDSEGVTFSKEMTIDIKAPISIPNQVFPVGQEGSDYSHQTNYSGGVMPGEWSVTVGALPDGLTLDESTGIISGTPTTSGIYQFAVKVVDYLGGVASAPDWFTIVVTPKA
jgi:hypothetical protein